MKKIIHVIGALVAGGAEKFVSELCIELNNSYAITLIVLSPRKDKITCFLIDKLRESDVNIEIGPSDKVGFATILWYRKIVKNISPDVVHLHTPNTETVHFMSAYKCRIFRTVHNTTIDMGYMTKLAIKVNNAESTIACGEAVDLYIKRVGFYGNSCVISNGVSFNWPIVNPMLRNQYQLKLNLNSEVLHFLSIGRMSGESNDDLPKAQDIIISAWTDFKKNYKGKAQLHLIGDGNMLEQLKIQASKTEDIIFHGVQSNIPEWLSAANWFLMPSRYEGLPIAGIEAVGTGVGCIFSDIEPLKQLNPPLVLWAKPNNIEDLVKALASASNPLQANIASEENVEIFRKQYAMASVAEKYIANYQKYLG
jgi:glycosyltransferase involved in cell wall biosynthesis